MLQHGFVGCPLRAYVECTADSREARNFPEAFEKTARRIRPNEEPFSWNTPPEWDHGWFLMKHLEEAGFGYKVEVKSVVSQVEAGSLEELVSNMLLFKGMFFKGYTEEEDAQLPVVLAEEIRELEAFEEEEGCASIKMVAWVGLAWK